MTELAATCQLCSHAQHATIVGDMGVALTCPVLGCRCPPPPKAVPWWRRLLRLVWRFVEKETRP